VNIYLSAIARKARVSTFSIASSFETAAFFGAGIGIGIALFVVGEFIRRS
jgi:hypothetical protein